MKRLPSSFVSSFLLHEHLTSKLPVTIPNLSPRALSILHSYMVCFLVVEFDNDIGPDLKLITPSYKFNEADFQKICFSSLPERTNPREESMEYMFRIDCTTDEIIQNELIFPSKANSLNNSYNYDPRYDGDYQNPLFAYVNFSQMKNAKYPRGYQQQSLVLIARHKLPNFYFKLLQIILDDQIGFLSMSIEEKFPVLEGALVGISNWPPFDEAMRINKKTELGFLGEVIAMEDPTYHTHTPVPGWKSLVPYFTPHQISSSIPYYLSSLTSALSLSLLPLSSSSSSSTLSLSLLYIIFQLLLLEVPIMVFSQTPDQCSNLILAAVDLLQPNIRYRGLIREYTTLNFLEESSRGEIIGVCNPFIIEGDKSHFIIIIENPGGKDNDNKLEPSIKGDADNHTNIGKQIVIPASGNLFDTSKSELTKTVNPGGATPLPTPAFPRSKVELLTTPFSWLSSGLSTGLSLKRGGKASNNITTGSNRTGTGSTGNSLGNKRVDNPKTSSSQTTHTHSNSATKTHGKTTIITDLTAVYRRNEELLRQNLFLSEEEHFLRELNQLLSSDTRAKSDAGADHHLTTGDIESGTDHLENNAARISLDRKVDAFIKSYFNGVLNKILQPLKRYIVRHGNFDYEKFILTLSTPTSTSNTDSYNKTKVGENDISGGEKKEKAGGLDNKNRYQNINYGLANRVVKTGIMNLKQLAPSQLIYGQEGAQSRSDNNNTLSSHLQYSENLPNEKKKTHRDIFINHNYRAKFYKSFTQTGGFREWCQETIHIAERAQARKRELFGEESRAAWR